MKETATQVNERKIRNGLRKQREKIEREKQKVWDRLKYNGTVKRVLRGGWTIEKAQDIEAQYGPDLEEELADALTAEIVAEQQQAWEDRVEQELKDFLRNEYNK